jgi:hypothetical protein
VHSQHIVKNRILGQLSADELKSMQPWLTPVELRSNVVLHEPGDAIEQVYFPLSGMISLLAVMQSGEAIETGIVGADGMLGGGAAINGHLFGQMTVQMDGSALTMPKAQFVEAYLRHPHLRCARTLPPVCALITSSNFRDGEEGMASHREVAASMLAPQRLTG